MVFSPRHWSGTATGFDTIPEDLNPEISPATLRALHERRGRENSLPVFYAHYLAGAVRGDLGVSQNLKVPVTELLRERAPVTAKLILWGTAGGWLLGGLLAWMAVWPRRVPLEAAAFSMSGLLLAIPPAVLALGFFFYQALLGLALSLALLPRLFGTMRALLDDCYASPALLAARSRGGGNRSRLRRGTFCWPWGRNWPRWWGGTGARFRIGYPHRSALWRPRRGSAGTGGGHVT